MSLLVFYPTAFLLRLDLRNRGHRVWNLLRLFRETTARHEDEKFLRSCIHAGHQYQESRFRGQVKATTAGITAAISSHLPSWEEEQT